MFDRLEPGVQRLDRVCIENGHGLLRNDRSVIDLLVDEMDGDPRLLDSESQRFFDRMRARERRQQRWMNVQDRIWEPLNGFGRKNPHEAGKHHEFNTKPVEQIAQRRGKGLA